MDRSVGDQQRLSSTDAAAAQIRTGEYPLTCLKTCVKLIRTVVQRLTHALQRDRLHIMLVNIFLNRLPRMCGSSSGFSDSARGPAVTVSTDTSSACISELQNSSAFGSSG